MVNLASLTKQKGTGDFSKSSPLFSQLNETGLNATFLHSNVNHGNPAQNVHRG